MSTSADLTTVVDAPRQAEAYPQPLVWLPDLIREAQATIAAVYAERRLTDGDEEERIGIAITLDDNQLQVLAQGGRITTTLDNGGSPTQTSVARLAVVADLAPEVWHDIATRCRAWRRERTALSAADHPARAFLRLEDRLPRLEGQVATLLLAHAINGVLTGVLRRSGVRPGPWLEVREVLAVLVADPIERLLQVGRFAGTCPLHALGVIETPVHPDSEMSIWGRDLVPSRSLLDECLGRRLTESFDRDGVSVLQPNLHLGDVVLDPAVADEVAALDLPRRLANRLDKPLWILLHGPSGTGKTMLAQAFAGEAKVPLLLLAAETKRELDGNVGLVGSLLRRAAHERAILFIDEADDLLSDGSAASRLLLASCDLFPACVVLATNAPLKLDPAMDRRLQVKLRLDIPASAQRAQILQRELARQEVAVIGQGVDPAVDRRLAALSRNYRLSGGYWRNIVQLAAMTAIPAPADHDQAPAPCRRIAIDSLVATTRRCSLARLSDAHPQITWVDEPLPDPPALGLRRQQDIDGLVGRLARQRDPDPASAGMILLLEGPEALLARAVADRMAAGLDLPLALVDARTRLTGDAKSPGRLFPRESPRETAVLLVYGAEGRVLECWAEELATAASRGLVVLMHLAGPTIPLMLSRLAAARLPWAALDPDGAAKLWRRLDGVGPVPTVDSIACLRAARARQVAAVGDLMLPIDLP